MGNQWGCRRCGCMDFTRNCNVFIRYLGAQASDGAHVLQFWSTYEYYRTVKYQLQRTNSDGDNQRSWFRRSKFVHPDSFRPWLNPPNLGEFWRSKTPNVRYLRHHGSDGADTLRFDSTDECFKTVEHEPDRMLELRDNLWKHDNFGKIWHYRSSFKPSGCPVKSTDLSAHDLEIDLARSSDWVWKFPRDRI